MQRFTTCGMLFEDAYISCGGSHKMSNQIIIAADTYVLSFCFFVLATL